MRYRCAIIAYQPRGKIHVAERTDNPSWAQRFSCVIDPGLTFRRKTTREQKIIQMLVDFVHAVRRSVDVDEADRAFRVIDEYKQLMERMP